MRSVLATIALMIGCIVGGYAWSALRAVSAKDECGHDGEPNSRSSSPSSRARQSAEAASGAANSGAAIPARNGEAGAAEALAHLPPCQVTRSPRKSAR